jgi:archaemetzincin
VFGLASSNSRTGVFSFARYDERFFDTEPYKLDYEVLFSRSLKVMVHEVTHMFGLKHCIYYSCIMNGSNHLEEGGKKPLELCPVCLRKLQLSLNFDIL